EPPRRRGDAGEGLPPLGRSEASAQRAQVVGKILRLRPRIERAIEERPEPRAFHHPPERELLPRRKRRPARPRTEQHRPHHELKYLRRRPYRRVGREGMPHDHRRPTEPLDERERVLAHRPLTVIV